MSAKKSSMFIMLAFLAIAVGSAGAHGLGANGYIAALQTLPININTWVPVAAAVVLLIIVIAALVYILSGFVGNENIRAWSMGQIYEALMSFVLLLIFAFFTYLFFLNPQPAFSSVGLVPPQCTSATTIYTLSACDISAFSGDAFEMAQVLFLVSYFAGITSGLGISVSLPTMPDVGASFGIESFIPASTESLLGTAFSAIVFMLILNQVQVILISGALLFLAIFMILGILARTFGITRTFGGAMIAFGLGLGLVYPLLVTITYGFITTSIGAISVYTLTENVVIVLLQAFFTAVVSSGTGVGLLLPNGFLLTLGYIVAGLTFLPFLNFTILDAFIVDFSQAMGQRMDFMSLISTLM